MVRTAVDTTRGQMPDDVDRRGRETAVEVRDLSFSYGPTASLILRHCSWTIPYGRLVLLQGASGSGKSTLLSCLAGMQYTDPSVRCHGDIFIAGHNIRGMRIQDIARHVGMVLQNPETQILHGRVEDEIAFGCENVAMTPTEIGSRVRDQCRAFDLDPNGSTASMSLGQQERLCCAAAFAMDRRIMLLDEPLASLDWHAAHIVMRELRQLADRGRTIVVCEHRTRAVVPYADAVFSLCDGAIQDSSVASLHEPKAPMRSTHRARIGKALPDKPLVEMHDVTVRRSGRVTLDIDHLAIHAGESVIVQGDNGAGKSTMLSVLAGVLRPATGHVLDRSGRETYVGPWRRLQMRLRGKSKAHCGLRVAMLAQNPEYQLFMPSVIQEMLARNADRARCVNLLHELWLDELIDEPPLRLSCGQQRRLALACCLVGDPNLLILDEPAAGQDERSLVRAMGVVRRYCRNHGCACVMATHDMRGLEGFVDRAVRLDHGRLLH